jgi:hypothetical protein
MFSGTISHVEVNAIYMILNDGNRLSDGSGGLQSRRARFSGE